MDSLSSSSSSSSASSSSSLSSSPIYHMPVSNIPHHIYSSRDSQSHSLRVAKKAMLRIEESYEMYEAMAVQYMSDEAEKQRRNEEWMQANGIKPRSKKSGGKGRPPRQTRADTAAAHSAAAAAATPVHPSISSASSVSSSSTPKLQVAVPHNFCDPDSSSTHSAAQQEMIHFHDQAHQLHQHQHYARPRTESHHHSQEGSSGLKSSALWSSSVSMVPHYGHGPHHTSQSPERTDNNLRPRSLSSSPAMPLTPRWLHDSFEHSMADDQSRRQSPQGLDTMASATSSVVSSPQLKHHDMSGSISPSSSAFFPRQNYRLQQGDYVHRSYPSEHMPQLFSQAMPRRKKRKQTIPVSSSVIERLPGITIKMQPKLQENSQGPMRLQVEIVKTLEDYSVGEHGEGHHEMDKHDPQQQQHLLWNRDGAQSLDSAAPRSAAAAASTFALHGTRFADNATIAPLKAWSMPPPGPTAATPATAPSGSAASAASAPTRLGSQDPVEAVGLAITNGHDPSLLMASSSGMAAVATNSQDHHRHSRFGLFHRQRHDDMEKVHQAILSSSSPHKRSLSLTSNLSATNPATFSPPMPYAAVHSSSPPPQQQLQQLQQLQQMTVGPSKNTMTSLSSSLSTPPLSSIAVSPAMSGAAAPSSASSSGKLLAANAMPTLPFLNTPKLPHHQQQQLRQVGMVADGDMSQEDARLMRKVNAQPYLSWDNFRFREFTINKVVGRLDNELDRLEEVVQESLLRQQQQKQQLQHQHQQSSLHRSQAAHHKRQGSSSPPDATSTAASLLDVSTAPASVSKKRKSSPTSNNTDAHPPAKKDTVMKRSLGNNKSKLSGPTRATRNTRASGSTARVSSASIAEKPLTAAGSGQIDTQAVSDPTLLGNANASTSLLGPLSTSSQGDGVQVVYHDDINAVLRRKRAEKRKAAQLAAAAAAATSEATVALETNQEENAPTFAADAVEDEDNNVRIKSEDENQDIEMPMADSNDHEGTDENVNDESASCALSEESAMIAKTPKAAENTVSPAHMHVEDSNLPTSSKLLPGRKLRRPSRAGGPGVVDVNVCTSCQLVLSGPEVSAWKRATGDKSFSSDLSSNSPEDTTDDGKHAMIKLPKAWGALSMLCESCWSQYEDHHWRCTQCFYVPVLLEKQQSGKKCSRCQVGTWLNETPALERAKSVKAVVLGTGPSVAEPTFEAGEVSVA